MQRKRTNKPSGINLSILFSLQNWGWNKWVSFSKKINDGDDKEGKW
jgi:hypothetical protein